jgi:hypothetical protein
MDAKLSNDPAGFVGTGGYNFAQGRDVPSTTARNEVSKNDS